MASGIYEIKNTKNGRVYVGSSVDIDQQWKQHRTELMRGTHHSVKLQRAWGKYGADAFDFSILELVHNRELLLKIEQMWMDVKDSARKGYNVAAVAGLPGRPDDYLNKDPSRIASSRNKIMSREALFPDEESKNRFYQELVVQLQKKALQREWPKCISPKKIARLAFAQWIKGGCSVCHGVANISWHDEDGVLHQIDCSACNGTGWEPYKSTHRDKEPVADAVSMLNVMYARAYIECTQKNEKYVLHSTKK